MRRTGHRQHWRPVPPGLFQIARNIQQVRCVALGFEARIENAVVTSKFTQRPQLTACNPKQWIEPVRNSRKVRQDLNGPVEAFDVCQFVRKDHTNSLVSPSFTFARNEDLWSKNSAGAQ